MSDDGDCTNDDSKDDDVACKDADHTREDGDDDNQQQW